MPLMLIVLAVWMALFASCAPHKEPAAETPLASAEHIDERGESVVLETLSASRYTYMRLEGAPKGTWHVVMMGDPEPGDRVAWRGYAALDDFHSEKLGRSFERVVFTSISPANETP